MIIATAVASIGIFLGALWFFDVVRTAADALATARGAVATIRDKGLDDAARERATRRASLQLIATFASILIRSALAFGASLLPIWLADVAGFATTGQVIDFLSRWNVILIVTALSIFGYLIWKRL